MTNSYGRPLRHLSSRKLGRVGGSKRLSITLVEERCRPTPSQSGKPLKLSAPLGGNRGLPGGAQRYGPGPALAKGGGENPGMRVSVVSANGQVEVSFEIKSVERGRKRALLGGSRLS